MKFLVFTFQRGEDQYLFCKSKDITSKNGFITLDLNLDPIFFFFSV